MKAIRKRSSAYAIAAGIFFGSLAILRCAGLEVPAKMCWAHYVAWGFDQVNGYDRAIFDPHWRLQKFNDRSLLGRHAQTDEGVGEATKLQIRTAIQYGIDGFCVDLPVRPDIRETFYADSMTRFHHGAEGTAFKVAPCIDGTSPAPDLMTRALAAYLERWRHHPNTCLIDGRPVIFIYNSRPRTLDEWRVILTDLQARGLAAYWLVQPMGEGSLWEKKQILADNLAVFDGFYDFGVNGFSADQMLQRLTRGHRMLERLRPGGLLVAGITQGYLGNANSFYRPYLNTGTLRDNWQAAVASGAQWVCLTTWNDYVEHTHFEPAAVGRDVMLRINREWLARWRDELPPPRPPQVFVSYHEEAVLGDDWTLEILNFSYTTPQAVLSVRVVDDAGTPVFEPAPITLPSDQLAVTTLRVPRIGMAGKRLLRVQARFVEGGRPDDWRELYPVVVRAGRMESLRTIRVALDSLAPEPRLRLEERDGTHVAAIRLERWNTAARVELLRNGWPVAEAELAHKGAPSVTCRLPLPASAATPADIYLARVSTLSGDVAWSAPAVDRRVPTDTTPIETPVIVSGVDFDEGWWDPPRPMHAATARVERVKITAPELFTLTYPLTEGDGHLVPSHSGWDIPLLLGGDHKGMRHNAAHMPTWCREAERQVLSFDGRDDRAILPSRTMPYGPFTLELVIRPARTDRMMTLFADTCGVAVELMPDGRLRFTRRKERITSARALATDRWTHLAAVYDGLRLALYLDGRLNAEAPAAACLCRINSLPILGNAHDGKTPYEGLLGGFHLQSGVRGAGNFAFVPHDGRSHANSKTQM
ncbi:MAG TPA: hypothetical protein P5111_08040 [Kiritimatiellia bacterium]|nr:hypothetical protein [Kiritimatiellia bacterium]